MPIDILILTMGVILILSMFGTVAMHLFFRGLEQPIKITTMLQIGFAIGVILNAIFLYWLVFMKP